MTAICQPAAANRRAKAGPACPVPMMIAWYSSMTPPVTPAPLREIGPAGCARIVTPGTARGSRSIGRSRTDVAIDVGRQYLGSGLWNRRRPLFEYQQGEH